MTIGVTLGVFMLSYVWLFETQWTITCQAPLSMEFPRQECWSGLPFPSPGDLPNPGMEPTFLVAPVLVSGFLTTCATWEAPNFVKYIEVNLTYPVHSPSVSVSPEQAFPPSLPGHLPCQCPCPSNFWHTQTHPASLSESVHLNFGYSSPTSKQSPHSLLLPSFKMENSRRDLDFHVVYSKGPCFKKRTGGISPSVQWLGLWASTAGGMGSNPGQETRIPHAMWPKNVLSFKAEFKALPLEKQPGYPLKWELIQ